LEHEEHQEEEEHCKRRGTLGIEGALERGGTLKEEQEHLEEEYHYGNRRSTWHMRTKRRRNIIEEGGTLGT
jgi:hypothetical protein